MAEPACEQEATELATLRQRVAELQALLQRQQGLVTAGLAAAMNAHEINNLLTPLLGYTRLALESPADAALREKALRKAQAAAERVSTLADAMLGLVRTSSEPVAPIARCVDDALACLGRDWAKDGIRLTRAVPAELSARIAPAALQQVLVNLLLNARTALLQAKGPRNLHLSAALVDRQVQIVVQDNGPGIAADLLPRVFDPLVTTGPSSASTGLGLAVCRELLRAAGGDISVASAPGAGAGFTVRLPATTAGPAK